MARHHIDPEAYSWYVGFDGLLAQKSPAVNLAVRSLLDGLLSQVL
jgi:hypothetical protein